jgi:hypothetical protein
MQAKFSIAVLISPEHRRIWVSLQFVPARLTLKISGEQEQ